jgi:hypothetical protein
MQLEGLFDLPPTTTDHVDVEELPTSDVLGDDWQIGLIVGPSGAGKSTVARTAFGDLVDPTLHWNPNLSVIDGFPARPITEITDLLSSVGFSSPPAWRRPFHVLSNGEQFRVTMARLLAEAPPDGLVVVDEFTSVVDRQVAQVGASAIARTIRRGSQRLVAVTCHYDVEDWLQPDWVYQPHIPLLTRRSVQPRPGVDVEIIRATSAAWPVFRPHHYLSADLNRSAQIILGLVDDQPAVFVALLPFPHARYRSAKRVHRVVTLPDYQGIGLGTSVLRLVGGALKHHGTALMMTSSHPAVVRSFNRSPVWSMTSKPRRTPKDTGKLMSMSNSRASNRLVTSFRYAGEADPTLAHLFDPPKNPRKSAKDA